MLSVGASSLFFVGLSPDMCESTDVAYCSQAVIELSDDSFFFYSVPAASLAFETVAPAIATAVHWLRKNVGANVCPSTLHMRVCVPGQLLPHCPLTYWTDIAGQHPHLGYCEKGPVRLSRRRTERTHVIIRVGSSKLRNSVHCTVQSSK